MRMRSAWQHWREGAMKNGIICKQKAKRRIVGCHSHCNDPTVKSQFQPPRPVHLSQGTHDILCSDLTVSRCLCNECKNVKVHIVFFIHFRKAKSDCEKCLIGQNKECSPLIDQENDEVSISSPISSHVNQICNSASTWKVWGTSIVRSRTIVSDCVVQVSVVVCYGSQQHCSIQSIAEGVCVVEDPFKALQNVFMSADCY